MEKLGTSYYPVAPPISYTWSVVEGGVKVGAVQSVFPSTVVEKSNDPVKPSGEV